MNDIVEAIVRLFEADGGYQWTAAEQEHAQAKWELLSDEDKAFLAELSAEDLGNVCIGETRYDEDGITPMWLVKGDWARLPPGVDAFLHDIWEFKS